MQLVVEDQLPVDHLLAEVVQFVAVFAEQVRQLDVVRRYQHEMRPPVEVRQHGFSCGDAFGRVRALEKFVEGEQTRRRLLRCVDEPFDGQHFLQVIARPFGDVVRDADRAVNLHVRGRVCLGEADVERLGQQGVEHQRADERGLARHVGTGK